MEQVLKGETRAESPSAIGVVIALQEALTLGCMTGIRQTVQGPPRVEEGRAVWTLSCL